MSADDTSTGTMNCKKIIYLEAKKSVADSVSSLVYY